MKSECTLALEEGWRKSILKKSKNASIQKIYDGCAFHESILRWCFLPFSVHTLGNEMSKVEISGSQQRGTLPPGGVWPCLKTIWISQLGCGCHWFFLDTG